MSSHIGGRGSPAHSDLVKDFFVMLMNFSFANTDSLAGMLQLIRYEFLLRSCLDILARSCSLLSISASGRYFYGTFWTTPQEFAEATQQGLEPVRDVEMREDIDCGDETAVWQFQIGIACPQITKKGRGLIPARFDATHRHTPHTPDVSAIPPAVAHHRLTPPPADSLEAPTSPVADAPPVDSPPTPTPPAHWHAAPEHAAASAPAPVVPSMPSPPAPEGKAHAGTQTPPRACSLPNAPPKRTAAAKGKSRIRTQGPRDPAMSGVIDLITPPTSPPTPPGQKTTPIVSTGAQYHAPTSREGTAMKLGPGPRGV